VAACRQPIGWEQQTLAIGRGLITAPRLLLLDEPSMGLAAILMQEIATAPRTLSDRGIAMLPTEQKAHPTLDFAQDALVLADGVIDRDINYKRVGVIPP
jgi:branched-chain amino acid transport system ATP-binding protein